MSETTVKDRVNTFLAGKWSALVDKQEFYYRPQIWTQNYIDPEAEEPIPDGPPVLTQDGKGKGRYWQGLWSHTIHIDQTDALDQDAPADALTSSPTDQAEDWGEFGTAFDGNLPCRIRIDTYDGPSGQGWYATVQVRYMGTIYQRSKGYGPVNHDAEWHVYTPVIEV
jgi:hypothetical protein